MTPSTTAISAPAAPWRASGAIRSAPTSTGSRLRPGTPCGERVVAGVDVVRPDLERRHGGAAAPQRGHEPGRHRRLPRPRRGRRDDEGARVTAAAPAGCPAATQPSDVTRCNPGRASLVAQHRVRDVRRLQRGHLVLARARRRAPRPRPRRGRASSRPTIGAVTASRCSIQASATCAGGRPRAFATSATACTTASSPSVYIRSAIESVSARVVRAFLRAPGQPTPRERAPRDHPDALVEAERVHLPLLLAVDQVVVVLHGREAGPAAEVGDVLGLRELPGVHARRPDVARLPRPHDVVQRLHRLLDRGVRVPAVDLVEVDVVGAQPPQRRVDRGQDVLAGQAAVVRARPTSG